MEPVIIEVEACNRFFIVEQRWGFDNGKPCSDSIGNRNNRPDQNIFETAYIFNPMNGPYARVYRDWCMRDNRRHPDADRPRFAYIVEARNRRQVVNAMLYRGHRAMFNSQMEYPKVLHGTIDATKILYGETLTVPTASAAIIFNNAIKKACDRDTFIADRILRKPSGDSQDAVYYEMKEEETMDTRTREIRMLEAARRRAGDRIDFLLSLPDEPTYDDDRPNVIFFEKRFDTSSRSRLYTYSAVKAGDGLWYTTGPQSPKGYTWDQLITWINDPEPTQVWTARKFKEI